MKKFFENIIGLLVYVVIGFVCFIVVGFEYWPSAGLSILFGFIMGILNEIHRDLTKLLDK